MRTFSLIIALIGASLLYSVGLITYFSVRLHPDATLLPETIIGAFSATLLVTGFGLLACFNTLNEPEAVNDEPIGWLDRPFVKWSKTRLIIFSFLFAFAMWLFAIGQLLFCSHTIARRRAIWTAGILSPMLALGFFNFYRFIEGQASIFEDAPALQASVPAYFISRTTNVPGFTMWTPALWHESPGDGEKGQIFTDNASGRFVILSENSFTWFTVADRQRLSPIELHKYNPAITVSDCSIVKINDRPALRLVFAAPGGMGDHMEFCQYQFIKDGRAYMLTYGAPSHSFAQTRQIADAIAVSVHLPNEPETVIALAPTPPPVVVMPVIAQPNAAVAIAPATVPATQPSPEKTYVLNPPRDLMNRITGSGTLSKDGVMTLDFGHSLTTLQSFQPPVDFHVMLLTNHTDTRIAYAADQIIFNWEMQRNELRVDGGPANGRHRNGVGELPVNRWTDLEVRVTKGAMLLFIDGHEIYQANGNFSHVNEPFSITAHNGKVAVRGFTVVTAKETVATAADANDSK